MPSSGLQTYFLKTFLKAILKGLQSVQIRYIPGDKGFLSACVYSRVSAFLEAGIRPSAKIFLAKNAAPNPFPRQTGG